MARQVSWLEPEPPIEGFKLDQQFITPNEELALLERIRPLEFHAMKMRGVVARRRVLHYGVHYSFETFKATPGPPIPEFLLPLRTRAAAFAGVDASDLEEALITEYSPGATIGWHRDAAPFDIVVGISLASACRFRFGVERSARGKRGSSYWRRAQPTCSTGRRDASGSTRFPR